MFKPILFRLGHWLATKTAPRGLTGNQWTGTGFTDSFKRNRNPTAQRAVGRAQGDRLDVRQHQCRRVRVVSAAALCQHRRRSGGAEVRHQGDQPRRVEQRLRAANHLLPLHQVRDAHSGSRRPSACSRCWSRSIRFTTPSTSGN